MKTKIVKILFLIISTTYSLFDLPEIFCQTRICKAFTKRNSILAGKDTVPPNPMWRDAGCGYFRGSVWDYPDDDNVRSNLDSIFMNKDSSFNYIFNVEPFTPGKSRYTYWGLDAIGYNQDARAVLTFTDKAGNDTTIDIRYYSFNLTIKEIKYDFGLLKYNSIPVKHTFLLKNESKGRAYIYRIGFKYENQHFTIDSSTIKSLPFFLNSGDSFKFDALFNPEMIGKFSDSIGVGDTSWFFYHTEIKAKVDEPKINVTDINFDTIPVNNDYSSKDFIILNKGGYDLKISGYSGPLNSFFSTNLSKWSTEKPLIITPNNFVKYTIFFKPEQEGLFQDSIIFFNDAGTPDSVCLIKGVAKTPLNVYLLKQETFLKIITNQVNINLQFSFALTEPGYVDVHIIDLKGNIVRDFESFYYSGGEQKSIINTNTLFSGVYFLELQCNNVILRNKFTIIK